MLSSHCTKSATGTTLGKGLTIICRSTVGAHGLSGVKVYVVLIVLSKAGLHVPVIPLSDVVGNGAKESPEHIGSIAVNVGASTGNTFTHV